MFAPIRGFTSLQRTPQADLKLGSVLAFVAGATNAGGFLAVGQYTSHMTGILSSVADHLVLGQLALAGAGMGAVLAFLLGAMTTAWLVNWGLRHELRSAYGLPLMLEASLLLVFGLFGAAISLLTTVFLPLTVVLLCFIMGLQNAVIRKGYIRFKKERDGAELAAIATRHGLAADVLQAFVDGILQRLILDGAALSDLMAPLDLGWKARAQAETALMADLIPLLAKRAQGREISGLSAYE